MPHRRKQSGLAKTLANDLIAKMPDVVLVMTYPGFELIYGNEAGRAWLSGVLGVSDLTGLDLSTAVAGGSRGNWANYIEAVLERGTSEHVHVGAAGRRWQLRLARQPAKGPCTAITVSGTDISDLADMRAQLDDSDLHYRTLFETMRTGVVYHKADGRVMRVNPAAEAILGFKEAEMIGWSPLKGQWDVIREDGTVFAGAEHPIMQVVRTGQPLDDQLLGVPHPDGRRRWIRLSARPVTRGADGGVENLVVCFHDVTEQQALRQQTQAQMAQLDRALEQSLLAMAEMIEQRDPYTAGHQQKVADLAERIAREMGLCEERCRIVRLAALVHDIGKNAVPLEMLVKPHSLTALEHEVIKQHVEAGYKVLSRIEFAQPVADVMRQHHERLDGSGYPCGLAGDDILLEARILAVADTVDAMANDRPYRKAPGLRAALAMLEQSAGTHYDADVVAALRRTLIAA
jgi:PAS domain S-box-containing protein/putative nucleotidyltransferase with HDIG domain